MNNQKKKWFIEKAALEVTATRNVGEHVTTNQKRFWARAMEDLFPAMEPNKRAARVLAVENLEATKDNA